MNSIEINIEIQLKYICHNQKYKRNHLTTLFNNTSLLQVNLDKDPIEMGISPEIFSILKKANVGRFEILKDLLSRTGVDCTPGSLPPYTPCYLMATKQVGVD